MCISCYCICITFTLALGLNSGRQKKSLYNNDHCCFDSRYVFKANYIAFCKTEFDLICQGVLLIVCNIFSYNAVGFVILL